MFQIGTFSLTIEMFVVVKFVVFLAQNMAKNIARSF
jgi:hypothetical protein